MSAFLTTLHVLACFFLVAVVLLQHGKGADIGAAFGSGASNTVFGSRGAGNFLTKLTTGAVIVFMFTSITLSYFGTPRSVTELLQEPPAEVLPEPAVEVPTSDLPEATPIPAAGEEASGTQAADEPGPPPSPGTESE